MKALPLISLGLSLALGAGAIFFGREFMSDRAPQASAAQPAPAIQMSRVMVAAARIEPGGEIQPGMVKAVDWPANALPAGAMRDMSALGERAYARGLIVPGEPLMAEKISLDGPVLTLASNITPGMRAVSIVVRNDTGVAGFVLPGDRVDVNEFVPLKIEGSTPDDARISANVIAKPVLRYVTVLAVDQTFAHHLEGARPSNTVTLEVTPEDALLLGAASQRAALGLALIGRKEERAEIAQAPAPQRAPRAQTRAPARPARTTTTVRVINGSNDASVTTPIAPPATPAGPVQLVGGED